MIRSALISVMVQAVRKAGRTLKRDFGEVEQLQVSIKGPGDFVSAADRRAEETLRVELEKARPGYSFLGEEGGEIVGTDATHRWIVDPLDGTTNFLHGIPHFAISVALERNGVLVAGVIYNPITDELYIAERGSGAFVNDRRLRVSARRDAASSVVGCGVPHLGRGGYGEFRKELSVVQTRFAGIRRFGAASLDLAYVAAGKLDAYWERNLKPWDVAAGIVLVREAGGFISDCDGGETYLSHGDICAGNEDIHKALLKAVKDGKKAEA
jgi:myo-inositol-1(or 4)-monophosphatase